MVIRKNISLEDEDISKLNKLVEINGGNTSAAIRDAIDISDAALRRYGSVVCYLRNTILQKGHNLNHILSFYTC